MLNPENKYQAERSSTSRFRGWLSDLGRNKKRFLLCATVPGGPLVRMTYKRVDQEYWRMETLGRGDRSAEGASSAEGLTDCYRDIIQVIHSKVVRHFYGGRTGPDESVWPSSGDEPDQLDLPPPLLRGGARSDDSDEGPKGPRIIAHQILTGPRVVIKRLEQATEEDSERVVEVEIVSDDSALRPVTNRETCETYEASSEDEGKISSGPGPSRPLKRARGRPRKDGSGPFKPPSPTIPEVVEMALGGEIPELTLADLVPIADRSRVRLGDKQRYVIRSDDSDADDPTDPRAERWWLRALDDVRKGAPDRRNRARGH